MEEDLNVLWERRQIAVIDKIRNIRRAKAFAGETPTFETTSLMKPLTEFNEEGEHEQRS